MITRIHVNQHVIRSNHKSGSREPVITCKNYKENQYGHQVIIYGNDGTEACRVIYSPDKPLSCGARVYIETHNEVEVVQNQAKSDKQMNLELLKDVEQITRCVPVGNRED